MENVETGRPVPVSTIASTTAAPAKALVALADRVRARSRHDQPRSPTWTHYPHRRRRVHNGSPMHSGRAGRLGDLRTPRRLPRDRWGLLRSLRTRGASNRRSAHPARRSCRWARRPRVHPPPLGRGSPRSRSPRPTSATASASTVGARLRAHVCSASVRPIPDSRPPGRNS